ncbi:uncharacterized protein ctdsp1 isoform X1 [Alosa alosa]|uniref:uncharacterized protein ctdsp1 isoform X1 n=1 Tax=Alosa alosa TaxID=278164 RepID=UPI0020154A1E|nr:uncharacterized protein ctdsp1 isoform X1 [Alosa alosa]
MSTCALLLVSQAACGLSESPQPPPQLDLSEHRMPSGHCLLSGESNTLGKCIEHFQAADFCSHFGAGGKFSQFFESSLRGEIVVQSPPIRQNMPEENCVDQTKVSGQEEHMDGNESFDDYCELCLNSVDQSSFDSAEVQGLSKAMEHICKHYEAGEVQLEQHVGIPEFPDQSHGTETFRVHSESSQMSQNEEVFFGNRLCTNLVTISEVSEQCTEQHKQFEQIFSTAELQTNNVESSPQTRSFEHGTVLGGTFELDSELSTVSQELMYSDRGGPLHSELPDPNVEHTESFQQCEPCTQCSGSEQQAVYIEVSESEVSESAFEKPSKRDQEAAAAADVFQSSEYSISVVDCELGEHSTSTDLKAENCEMYGTLVEQPFNMCDIAKQPVSSGKLGDYCASTESSQHAQLCNVNTFFKEQMLPDAIAADECQPTENTAEHSKTPEQCETSEHFELAEQCGSLDSCAKYYRAHKINKPCHHHSSHCEPLTEQQKTRRNSKCDTLLTGSMDTFETLWLSQFLIERRPDASSLKEYECCENCNLCDRSSEDIEVSEDRLSPDQCDAIQLEEKVQSCGHSFEHNNSEVSVHCVTSEESETTTCSAVSYHNESSQQRKLSGTCVESQGDDLYDVCTDTQCEIHKDLDFFLDQDGLFELNSEEGSDISRSYKPDVDSLDGLSEGDDYHPCNEKSQDSSETEESFKTCSDGSESDENCSESSYNSDKLSEEAENDHFPIQDGSFDGSPHDDNQEGYLHYTDDGVHEFSLECENQSCSYLWTAEDPESADLCSADGDVYEGESHESSVEERYTEEDGSEPDSEGDRLEPQIDEEGPKGPVGAAEVSEDSPVEKTEQEGQLLVSPPEEKLSQPAIGYALYQSQTLRLFLERRRLSAAEAYGHYGADFCSLDLIFDPWAEVETKDKEPSEVVAEAEKERSESGSVQEDDSEVHRKDEPSVECDEGKTPSPDNCDHHGLIPDIIFSEVLDENKDEEIGELYDKNEGLLTSPEIPYGIEASETPEPLCPKDTDEVGEELSDLLTSEQGEWDSEQVEQAKLPEPKCAESVMPEILLSDLITQQTKPTKNSVDHAKTSENNVESTEHSEHCATHQFFKLADERKTPEPLEEPEEIESEDEDIQETCQCEFCVPTEEVPAKPLLPQIKSKDAGKICVVIDLDETLVHSSFKPVNNADFIIPVEIDGTVHQVYVLKRPHVDEFLKRMGELFECVLFTASLAKYADPVSDLLDKWGAFRSRLFRESCVFHRGNYVKDLSRLGRDLNKVIIVDNSPASYIFHPDNAVPVASWFDDMADTELLDLIPFFERLSKVDDVYAVLKQHRTTS